MKMLLAADGSPYTRAAADYIATNLGWFAAPPEIHVVNVQPPLPYPRAQAVVGKAAVLDFQRQEAEAALAVAASQLEKMGVPFKSAWLVGEIASEIEAYVKANAIDLVVMGSHGHGALGNLALGSVATKCIARLSVPVMIVRAPAQKPSATSVQSATSVPSRARP